MIGLATGLHLLNLLAIPFITLIIYFRKYKVEWKSFGINVLITAVIFFVIHNGIIKGLPKMAILGKPLMIPLWITKNITAVIKTLIPKDFHSTLYFLK